MDSWNLHRRHLTLEFRNLHWAQRHAAGESKRAIAAKDGVSHTTVIRAIESISGQVVHNAPPAPQPSPQPPKGVEREAMAQKLAPPPDVRSDPRASGERGAQGDQRPPPAERSPEPPKVTGRDGKKYPATKPRRAAAGRQRGPWRLPRPERVYPFWSVPSPGWRPAGPADSTCSLVPTELGQDVGRGRCADSRAVP